MKKSNDEIIPIFKQHIYQGIPLIDAANLSYTTWHLLNEALLCFLHHEYFACMATLCACLEEYLKKKFSIDKSLYHLIKLAKSKELLSKEEASDFNDIRKWRNTYIHQDESKLPQPVKARTVKWEYTQDMAIDEAINAYGWDIDISSKEEYADRTRDLTSMATLALIAYGSLNIVIEFFQKKYPLNPPYIYQYYISDLKKIKGTKYDKEVFFFAYLSRPNNFRTRFVEYIKRLLGYSELPVWGLPPYYPLFRIRACGD